MLCTFQIAPDYSPNSTRLPASPNQFGRGREIRTPDILLPKQTRYQTALYPDTPRFQLETWRRGMIRAVPILVKAILANWESVLAYFHLVADIYRMRESAPLLFEQ